MIKNISSITFSLDRYQGDRKAMFSAIATQVSLLMENDYVCKIYDDDTNIIVVEYEHDNRKDYWGGPELEWLDEEEMEVLESYRLERRDSKEDLDEENS